MVSRIALGLILGLVLGLGSVACESTPDEKVVGQSSELSSDDESSANEELDVEFPEADRDGVIRLTVNPENLASGWFIVLLEDENCPVVRNIEDAFRSLAVYLHEDIRFISMNPRELEAFEVSEWSIPVSLSLSPVLLIEDGVVVDLHIGAVPKGNSGGHERNIDALQHLLARNGLIPFDPQEFVHEVYLAPSDSYDRWSVMPIDLSGQDFEGKVFQMSNFSGTVLRSANLAGVNFFGATFAGADLEGANLIGAELSETTWLNTRCPDGSMSEENNSTCSAVPMK